MAPENIGFEYPKVEDVKQTENTSEQRLSPEQIESIMGKVIDINIKGTAHHSFGPAKKELDEIMSGILAHGISPQGRLRPKQVGMDGQRYRDEVREIRNETVFFNIVGRAMDGAYGSYGSPSFAKSYTPHSSGTSIIFDLSGMDELAPGGKTADEEIDTVHDPKMAERILQSRDLLTHSQNEFIPKEKPGPRPTSSYWAYNHPSELYFNLSGLEPGRFEIKKYPAFEALKESGLLDERGFPLIDPTEGFATPLRISPRRFQGIVVDEYYDPEVGERQWDERDRCYDYERRDRINREINQKRRVARAYYRGEGMLALNHPDHPKNSPEFKKRVQHIVDLMLEVYQDRPERILPIYDVEGDLLWPRHMSIEEVREYVSNNNKINTEDGHGDQHIFSEI